MDYEKKQEIPFGVFDSELMEATYFIPQGYHAVIEGDKVIIKKGEDPVSKDLSWLDNCWPKYCSNQTIIEGFKEAIK
jgi:hypothetical protein